MHDVSSLSLKKLSLNQLCSVLIKKNCSTYQHSNFVFFASKWTAPVVQKNTPIKFVLNSNTKHTHITSQKLRNNPNKTSKHAFTLQAVGKYSRKLMKRKLFYWTALGRSQQTTNKKAQELKKKARRSNSSVSVLGDFFSFTPLAALWGKAGVAVIAHNLTTTVSQRALDRDVATALRLFFFLKFNKVALQLVSSLYFLLVFKETQPLATFIQTLFQGVHYSKHSAYLSFVSYLVRKVIRNQLKEYSCLGVKCVFKGKLGVGGNSRKSTLRYSAGMNSTSSKFIKINRRAGIIRTKTGSIGFSVLIAW